MDMTSPEMAEIKLAIMNPDKGQARVQLLAIWERLSGEGAPLQLCSIAHVLADTESDAARELEWDLRALEAATGSREPDVRDPMDGISEGMLPSLHLSVGEGYRRLGELDRARRHLERAAERINAAPDDAYGQVIKGGLRRLQALLASR